MKQNRLTIQIHKSASEIFAFTLNPSNTPKWISSIFEEKTNENPTKLGTIYENTGADNKWNTYAITEFEKNKLFTLTSGDKNYHCRYTFRPIDKNKTELEYCEWVDEGALDAPFTLKPLRKLKSVLENLG